MLPPLAHNHFHVVSDFLFASIPAIQCYVAKDSSSIIKWTACQRFSIEFLVVYPSWWKIPVRWEKIRHYTGFSSLFSSLQCISCHPNRRQPEQSLRTRTPALCSIAHREHPTSLQYCPQAQYIIDLTETGENWFCVIGSCSSVVQEWFTKFSMATFESERDVLKSHNFLNVKHPAKNFVIDFQFKWSITALWLTYCSVLTDNTFTGCSFISRIEQNTGGQWPFDCDPCFAQFLSSFI